MAEHSSSDARLHVSATPPLQISKDFHGTDNPIPLSPQWLLPKPGESKSGTGTGENNVTSNPPYCNRTDAIKTSGNGEDLHDANKRKDVFRPSMLDSESRRDRWRDEERDTKFSIRKDRWRDGDKDIGDARRVDRWTENLSTRPFGETRRGTSDRWNEPSNKETNLDQRREREINFDQRRESKWNTRWGPDDKESEGLREKWSDSVKEGDMHLDKRLTHISNHVKDEEGDHYRPWRPNSSQNRGRGELPYQQNSTPNKQHSTFSYARGRSESTPPPLAIGRSRASSSGSSMNSIPSYSQSPGTILDKVESVHREYSPFRFSRTKMLEVYQVTDMHKNRKLVDDFVQVPNLTQEELVEPLALCAPNSEELAVLDGIDKGEINSSGAPQVQKDGRNSTEFTHSRRMKLGGSPFQDRNEDGGSHRVANEVPSNRESTIDGNISVHPGTEWRAMLPTEHSNTILQDGRDMPSDIRLRNLDMGWSHHPKDPHNQWEGNLGYISDTKDVNKWQASADPILRKQPSGILDNELETRRVMQTSPEELSLCYKDPQGKTQGPFKGIDIIGWFEAGYFGIDLPVRLETAAADSWSPLGDVMPHLRAKAQPPPGFPAAKLNDLTEASGQQNSGGFGNIHGGLSGIHQQSSTLEAENRFLESLMSGSKSSPPLDSLNLAEGLQGFAGNDSGNLGSSGVDGGNNLHILAKRMALERQKSLSNPYPYWPGREAASLVSKSDIVPEATPPPKLLSSVSDNSRLPQSQNTDLMSIIQGLSERSSVGLNNGVGGWSNYPEQSGVDPLQHKIDLHRDQNFPQMPFGFQQQRLQAQNQMALINLLAQTVDNPSGILTAEKLLAAGLSQDPQVLNLLQQQYLLQLHSQAAVPAQQLLLLDKLLLLKQQQKQEEEQQLLLRQQQQQQLLSQVLQEQHSHQHFGESSYGQLQGSAIPIGNLRVDASQVQPLQEMYTIGSQTTLPSIRDELNTNSLNIPPQVKQDTSYNVTTDASSVHLPHQLFGNVSHPMSWDLTAREQLNDELQLKEPLPVSTFVESSLSHKENRSGEEHNIVQKSHSASDNIVQKSHSASDFTAKAVEPILDSTCRTDGIVTAVTSDSNNHCVAPVVASAVSCGVNLPQATDLEIKTDVAHEEQQSGKGSLNIEPSVADVRTVEAREHKKASEKKSKKQKSSKSQSSDHTKGVQKTPLLHQTMQSEAEKLNANDFKLGKANKGESHEGTRDKGKQPGNATVDVADPQEINELHATFTGSVTETDVIQGDLKAVDSVSTHNNELHVGQRAWKPASGFKPKSLLEIQQEEQRWAQTERAVSEITSSVSTMNVSTPWAGVVANPDSTKISNESHREVGNTEYVIKPESVQNPESKKSALHDLLAEEVLKKSSERDAEDPVFISSLQNVVAHSESADDDNFIEAKDSKRSRKKSTKSKGSGAKAPMATASSELPAGSSLVEKGKSSRSVQPEKEVSPAIPAGPSLGDFVPWKGESVSPSPSPAWSTDSGRIAKPTSLRDILKEQEKKASSAVPANHVPAPQISQPAQATRSSGPSWSVSASSPAKAASPIQMNSRGGAQSKYKGDDDLFWGPIEQSKQSEYPQLSSQGSSGSKIVPLKGNLSGPLTRQKSVSGKLTERSSSSLPNSSQSLLKLKKDAVTKYSEAMGFRDWCENECVRLLGTRDTSFLEFCLKQSRSEAQMLLIENLGSYDPDHEFIDKFLNYKELLPSDVLEIAFQSRSDAKVPEFSAGHVNSGNADTQDIDHTGLEGSTKGGGKKKGKKGKKVSPSVLGFNVVSNRIMMGEIQTVEE